MTYYAVVLIERGKPQFTYAGRDAFITSIEHLAEDHLAWCKEQWPNEVYQIVEFQVELT